jgi:hypothetical protein
MHSVYTLPAGVPPTLALPASIFVAERNCDSSIAIIILIIMISYCQAISVLRTFLLFALKLISIDGGEPYSPTMPCLVFFWARSTIPDKRQRSPR